MGGRVIAVAVVLGIGATTAACKRDVGADKEHAPRAPAGAIGKLAPDTAFVVTLSVASLRQTPEWPAIRDVVASRGALPLDEISALCGFDLFDRVETISVVGDASWEPDRAAILAQGLDRASFDSCAVTLAKEVQKVTLEIEDGAVTTYRDRESGLEMYAAWLADDAVLVTPGDVENRAMLSERLGENAGELVDLYRANGPIGLVNVVLAPAKDTPIAAVVDDIGAGSRAIHLAATLGPDGLQAVAGFHFAYGDAAKRGAAELEERTRGGLGSGAWGAFLEPTTIARNGDHVTATLALDGTRTRRAFAGAVSALEAAAASSPPED